MLRTPSKKILRKTNDKTSSYSMLVGGGRGESSPGTGIRGTRKGPLWRTTLPQESRVNSIRPLSAWNRRKA